MSDKNNPPSAGGEPGLLDLMSVLAANARLLVLVPLAAGALTYGATYLLPNAYTASVRVVTIPQARTSSNAVLGLVRSEAVADKVIDRLGPRAVYGAQDRDQARDRLSSRTRAYAIRDGFVTLEAEDSEPAQAATIANAYAEELLRAAADMGTAVAQRRRAIVESDISEVETRAKQAREVLEKTDSGRKLLRSALQARAERAALQAQINAHKNRIARIEGSTPEDRQRAESSARELYTLHERMLRVKVKPPAEAVSETELQAAENLERYDRMVDLTLEHYALAEMTAMPEAPMLWLASRATAPHRPSGPPRAFYAVTAAFLAGFSGLMFVLAKHQLRAEAPRR